MKKESFVSTENKTIQNLSATDNIEIQWIIRKYYEKPYGNKMYNLKEIDRFLENFNPPRLNQKEIEIMNNLITSTDIKTVTKKSPQNIRKNINFKLAIFCKFYIVLYFFQYKMLIKVIL